MADVPRLGPAIGVLSLLLWGATASAQVFGTFPWQMQPYCNVVTLTLRGTPAGFTLDGVDDQCGATNKASAVGVAAFGSTGNVTLNFTIVTAPSGKAVHVSAVVSPGSGNGTWSDDGGRTGTFAFFGGAVGLAPRPTAAAYFRTVGAAQQLIGVGVTVPVTAWTSVELDNAGGGVFDPTLGNYTVSASGVYAVATTLRLVSGSTTGQYCGYLFINGLQRASQCAEPSLVTAFRLVTVTSTMRLSAGDLVNVRMRNETGAQGGIGASAIDNVFTVTRLQ